MAYGGDALLNLVVSRFYTAKRGTFAGNGTESGQTYTYDVLTAPGLRLIGPPSAHNLELDLRVRITVNGFITYDGTIPMLVKGKISLNNGVLALTVVSITTVATGLDKAVVTLINKDVKPKLNTALAAIPIPNLADVFGSGLAVRLITGRVLSGPALALGGRITGVTGLAGADAPAPATLTALDTPPALLAALISEAAANALIRATTPPLSLKFDKKGTKLGFGAGIKGTIRASVPVLDIHQGRGSITTTISFTGLKGGIKTPIPFTKGGWVALPSPTVKVTIAHSLTATSNAGFIVLNKVAKITLSLNFPAILKPVEGLVEQLLSEVLTDFGQVIDNVLNGRRFQLFKLPTTVPGTLINANLAFTPNGLGYFLSSIQALIRVT